MLKVKVGISMFLFTFIIAVMYILNDIVEEKALLQHSINEHGITILRTYDKQSFQPREYMKVRIRKTADQYSQPIFYIKKTF